MNAMRECRYCRETHGSLLLCEPAKRVLDALADRGQRFDMPTIEFPEPVMEADAFGDRTVLCAQLVVKAGTTPVAGIPHPVLILTGQDLAGEVLPQWILPGAGPDLEHFAQLVAEMTEMAIRRARKERAAMR